MALPKSLRIVTESYDENAEEISGEIPEERLADNPDYLGESSDYEDDPVPAPARRRKSKLPAKQVPGEANRATVRRVAGDIAGCVEMVSALWAFSGDHCCSPVLEAQAKDLGDAIAGILKRYPRLLSKLDESDFMSLLIQAGLLTSAMKPVATAIYRNHIVGGKEDEPEAFDQFTPYRPTAA